MTGKSLVINDVGDGLHATISQTHKIYSSEGIIIDYGGDIPPQKEIFEGNFVLSHFHADHYNGFYKRHHPIPHLHLSDIYYPAMPKFKNNSIFFEMMLAMQAYLSFEEGDPIQYSILKFIRDWNCKTLPPVNFHPVSQGDNVSIDGEKVEILWPPREILQGNTLVKIDRSIKAFKDACAVDERLKEIYKLTHELASGDKPCLSSKEQQMDFQVNSKINYQQKEEHRKNQKVSLNTNQMTAPLRNRSTEFQGDSSLIDQSYDDKKNQIISIANSALKSAANDLSLAFMCESALLFLGDLESSQIARVVGYLKTKSRTNFDVIIAAHHGTHWNEQLHHLSARNCFASVGRLVRFLKPQYNLISTKFANTKDDGQLLHTFP